MNIEMNNNTLLFHKHMFKFSYYFKVWFNLYKVRGPLDVGFRLRCSEENGWFYTWIV